MNLVLEDIYDKSGPKGGPEEAELRHSSQLAKCRDVVRLGWEPSMTTMKPDKSLQPIPLRPAGRLSTSASYLLKGNKNLVSIEMFKKMFDLLIHLMATNLISVPA